MPIVHHDIGFYDRAAPAIGIGGRDAGAFDHRVVLHQHVFDLYRRNVVAGRDDHLVMSGDILEITVFIAPDDVLKNVPALSDHFLLLVRFVPVNRAGRPTGREQTVFAIGQFLEGFGVKYRDVVTGDRMPQGRRMG